MKRLAPASTVTRQLAEVAPPMTILETDAHPEKKLKRLLVPSSFIGPSTWRAEAPSCSMPPARRSNSRRICNGRPRPAPLTKRELLFPLTVRFETVIVAGKPSVVLSIRTFLTPALVMNMDWKAFGAPADQLTGSCQKPDPELVQELGWARRGRV